MRRKITLRRTPRRRDWTLRLIMQPPFPLSSPNMHTPVTLALVNARIWTGDSRRPWADAMAVAGNTIVAVGSSAEIKKLAGTVAVIDAKGQMVVPGFVDSHVHFLQGGLALQSVQLRDAKTREEFVRRIAAFAVNAKHGTWIERGDWDHELWGGELPTREWIDAVTPDHPVWINRLDGHMALANTLALKAAGITRDTPDVDGGTIVRDARGNPTGVFKDNAMLLVSRAIPALSDAAWDSALHDAMQYVASHGVTSVHNMGYWEELAVFKRAHDRRALRTRIYAAVPLASWEQLRDDIEAHGRGDDWLTIGGLKAFVDGSLGSHTAAMLEPFTDAPNDTGLLVNDVDDLYRWTRDADAAGLQVIVHAIGDRAIRLQLDVYERVMRENGARDRRFRIEHAQHLSAPDVPRFGALGVIASVQPYHAIDDGRWAERVIGPERAKLTYAFNSLLKNGASVAFGSDWFVAPPVPLLAIDAAVNRRTLDGLNPGGWIPAEKVLVEQALRAHTIDAARAGFQDTRIGSIERGKLADFVVIDRDLTRVPTTEISEARVVMTVLGGRIVYGGL
ncbi:MAG: amidohydrolase [Phycisphaerae bacterium]|nr:amidohydrolase [Gemmatimonadaceae bacterium]